MNSDCSRSSGSIAGVVVATIPVPFKEIAVLLARPLHHGRRRNRLTVALEVSQSDFTIALNLVSGGSSVPGLNTR